MLSGWGHHDKHNFCGRQINTSLQHDKTHYAQRTTFLVGQSPFNCIDGLIAVDEVVQ